MAEKVWYAHKGADKIEYAENRLKFEFPADFRKLYEESDGFGMDINYSYVHFWCVDSILAADEIFCEIEKGRYIFFADADDCLDCFAYDRQSWKIHIFSTENGIDEGRYCADNIAEMTDYIRNI